MLQALLVPLGIAVGLTVWVRPRAGLFALVVAVFLLDWFTEELALLPHAASWAVDGLVAVFVLRALFPRGGRLWIPAFVLVGLLLIGLASAQALALGTPPFRIALGARATFKFVLLFFALVNLDFSQRTCRGVIGLYMVFLFLQLPVSIYEWAILGVKDDLVFGTVRSSGFLAILVIFGICILVGLYVKVSPHWRYVFATGLLFIPPVLGEAKAFFFLLPVTMLVLMRTAFFRSPGRTAFVSVGLSVFMVVALVAFPRVDGNAHLLQVFTNPRMLLEAMNEPLPALIAFERSEVELSVGISTSLRVTALREAWSQISARPATLFFGYGLGSKSLTYEERLRVGFVWKSPFANRLYELGCVGVALYWSMFYLVFRSARPLQQSHDRFWRAIAFAFSGIVFTYVISDFYTEHMNDALAGPFWLLSACIVVQARREDRVRHLTREPTAVRPMPPPSMAHASRRQAS